MRPIRLIMQAFGSYGDKTTIDFTKPEQNLFLITGDTGAGKSTIFDALVFALYGEVSSSANAKTGRDLQSQFAGEDVEPFVELKFSEKRGVDTQTYTVRRSPAHARTKKRGQGLHEEGEKVSLFMPEGNEYSNNLRETDAKIAEIVGLDKLQFMQIAMIAQGEFMELLRAKPGDRKEIFRKLFNTQIYEKIVRELDIRRKNKEGEIAQIRTVCQTEIGHVLIPDGDEKAGQMEELRRTILSSDRLHITELEKFLQELALLNERLTVQESTAKADYDAASADRDARRDAFTKAENRMATFDKLEKSEKELRECEEEEESIQKITALISSIHTACDIQAVYQRYREAADLARSTDKNLQEQKEQFPQLKKELEKASLGEETALEAQTEAVENYTIINEKVENALKVLDRIDEARENLKNRERTCQKARNSAGRAKKKYEEFEAQIAAWRAESEKLKDADLLLEKWRQRKEETEAIARAIDSLREEHRKIQEKEDEASQAEKAYAAARDAYASVYAAYLQKQNAFLDAQAGYLAKEKLLPGQPCPVCGSVDHPNPCKMAEEDKDLTREKIDQLSGEVSACQADQEQKAALSHTAKELLKEQKDRYEREWKGLSLRMRDRFPDVSDALTPEKAKAMVDQVLMDLQDEGEKLSADSSRCAVLRKNLQESEGKKEGLKRKQEQSEDALKEADQALSADQVQLNELEKQKVYPSKEDAKSEKKKAQSKKNKAVKDYAAAQKAAREARTALDASQALIERDTKELPKQQEKEKALKMEYEKILDGCGLTEEEWQDITRQYQREDVAGLQERVDAHKNKKAAAERACQDAKEQIGPENRPDLAALEQARLRAEEKLDEAQAAYDRIKEIRRADTDTYDQLLPKMEERARVVQEHSRIESLYDRLAGKVSGGRMDIESFAQRYYLQKILDAANIRFYEMSCGQFELRMVDEEQAGKGGNHGLDLTVYSMVTGKERKVDTLSGGESFLAALSMALGMADQIRMSSGSVNLDIMFIDEGFGSLDDNARNQAVRVLQQMAGGDKLIGIISHVTELKQQIDDQLLVTKDEKGSHAGWL